MDDAPVPYVWLAPAGESAGSYGVGTANERDDARVVTWGRARGLRLTRPAKVEATAPPADDGAVAERVEAALTLARDGLAAGDAPAVDAALAAATALLAGHPEVLQAAWLRAEIERSRAARLARLEPKDEAAAARALTLAAALDGGRAAGLGEVAAPPAQAATRIALRPRDALVVLIDGQPAAGPHATLVPGPHHVVVRRAGQVAWAGWVDAVEGQPLPFPDLSGTDCSTTDFRSVEGRGGVIVAPGVRCSRWIAFLGDEGIAQCRGSQCGPVVWSKPTASLMATPTVRREDGAPRWLPWVAAGVGAALATTSIILSTGAFERPAPETRFSSGGFRTQ